MRSNKTKIIVYAASVLAITSSILFPQLIKATRIPLDQKVEQKNDQNIPKADPNTLIFKANSHVDKSKFITKENIIKEPGIRDGGKLLSADLVTYDQFSREILGKPNPGTMIENDRMVWVVKIDYPNGIKTRGGKFSKAVQISAYDSETGRFLSVTTDGQEDKN